MVLVTARFVSPETPFVYLPTRSRPVARAAARPLGYAGLRVVLAVTLAALFASARAADTVVALNAHDEFATFYLSVDVGGGRVDDYLVDTGAGYMTITEATLAHLEAAGRVRFQHQIEGHLADGSVLTVPIYLIDEIVIGSQCVLREVEAAVLPGASRGLMGLSVLRRASPFEFTVNPPSLRLSNCSDGTVLTASAGR